MVQYIDKSAVVVEIKKCLEYANNGILYAQSGVSSGLKEYNTDLNVWQHCQSMCKQILSFLDTLEVKEVDLEKEIDKELDEEWYGEYIDLEKFKRTAKHFYELGLHSK